MCHWNVNSVPTHNYLKAIFLQAYIMELMTLCLSETYLNNSIACYNLDENFREKALIQYKNLLK